MASIGGVSPWTIAPRGGSGTTVGAVTTNSSVAYGDQVLHIMPGAPTWTNPDATTVGRAIKKMDWWRNGYLAAAVSAPLPTARPVVESSDFVDGYLIGPQSDLWLVVLTVKHVRTMRPHYADMRSGIVSLGVWLPVLSGTYTGIRRSLVTALPQKARRVLRSV